MFDDRLLHNIVMGVSGLILLGFVWAFIRVINGANTLEWADLISTVGRDGKQHADWNRVGQGGGVIISLWLPAVYVYSPKMEAIGLAAVMGVALAYLGGVSAYASTLRARQGTVTTTQEPVADPALMKTTIEQTPPITPPNNIAIGAKKE